jgi:predicted metal-dependent enzyme (double-stranded beta helix superfamily)
VTTALAVDNLAPLRDFVRNLAVVLETSEDEPTIVAKGRGLLAGLIATDDWLPDSHATADPARYRQYLLYRDPADRFSVVSFVWGPGQRTPVHDHTVWGLIGMLRGSEIAASYERTDGGLRKTTSARLDPGQVDAVSPTIGDVHLVSNAYDDRVSVSIHVYGADIGKVQRSIYDLAGNPKPFVSGYAPAPALKI